MNLKINHVPNSNDDNKNILQKLTPTSKLKKDEKPC